MDSREAAPPHPARARYRYPLATLSHKGRGKARLPPATNYSAHLAVCNSGHALDRQRIGSVLVRTFLTDAHVDQDQLRQADEETDAAEDFRE